MSDAIRCGQCRWWRKHVTWRIGGVCELNPPMYAHGDPQEPSSFHQPATCDHDGCSRGEPKPSPLTVSDGVPVAMVDGLPVFCSKKTEDST